MQSVSQNIKFERNESFDWTKDPKIEQDIKEPDEQGKLHPSKSTNFSIPYKNGGAPTNSFAETTHSTNNNAANAASSNPTKNLSISE